LKLQYLYPVVLFLTGCVETSNQPQAQKPVNKPYTEDQCSQAWGLIDKWNKNLESSDDSAVPKSEKRFVENSLPYCPKVKKRVDIINAQAAQYRKKIAERKKLEANRKAGICKAVDEGAFVRASAQVKAAAANTSFSKSIVEISRCGYMTVTKSGGVRFRANLDSLYGKIGSPSWELAVAARSLTTGSGKTYQNASMFSFSSQNGKKVTRNELESLNQTLRTLARSSIGRNSSSVNIDQELADAASLEKAVGRIHGAIGTVVTGAVKAADQINKSGGTRTYQCEIQCSDFKSDGRAYFSVYANSVGDAHAKSGNGAYQACRPHGGVAFLAGAYCE